MELPVIIKDEARYFEALSKILISKTLEEAKDLARLALYNYGQEKSEGK